MVTLVLVFYSPNSQCWKHGSLQGLKGSLAVESTDHEELVRNNAFRSEVAIGAVPGQMVAREGSVPGRIRVIQYEGKKYQDVMVESVADLATLINQPTEVTNGQPEIESSPSAALDGRTDRSLENGSFKVVPANTVPKAVWVNVDGVGDIDLLKDLAKMFGIHPLAMEDVVNVHQHAKLEVYGETLFFVARMPSGSNGFETEQVSVFLMDNAVITIQERPGDCLEPVRHRIENSLGRIRKRGPDYLMYAIIDAIVDGYFPVLERYGDQLNQVALTLQSQEKSSLPMRLHQVRADLLSVRKVIDQHRTAINDLLLEAAEFITSDTSLYFRDCLDHLHRLAETADTDRETCGELRELYFAMLSEKNNDVMKVLTIIATLFIPMSFIAGIYGMNFDSQSSSFNMPELRWAYGYPFALGLMAAMASGLLSERGRSLLDGNSISDRCPSRMKV